MHGLTCLSVYSTLSFPPPCPQDLSLHLCLYSCPENMSIYTMFFWKESLTGCSNSSLPAQDANSGRYTSLWTLLQAGNTQALIIRGIHWSFGSEASVAEKERLHAIHVDRQGSSIQPPEAVLVMMSSGRTAASVTSDGISPAMESAPAHGPLRSMF